MPEYAATYDYSQVASLERLLSNTDALIDAQQAETAAIDRANLLRQNPPSMLDRASNAIRNLESGGTTRTATTPRPMNAPVQIRIPSDGATVTSSASALGTLGRVGGVLSIPSQLNDLRISASNTVTGFQNMGRLLSGNDDLLPYENYPIYDRLVREDQSIRDNFERASNETRENGYLGGLVNRSPVLSGIRDFASPITCSLFGVGCDNSTDDGVPFAGDNPPPPPPFQGGQLEGVEYRVQVNYKITDFNSVSYGIFQSITGRITFVGIYTPRVVDRYNDYGEPIYAWRAYAAAINSAGDVLVFGGTSGGFSEAQARSTITYVSSNIFRADGLPDTGGNPAPLPGTQPGSITMPIVNNPFDNETRQRNSSQTATPSLPSLVPSNPPNPAEQPNEEGERSPVNPFNPGSPANAPNPPNGNNPENNEHPRGALGGLSMPPLIPIVGRAGTPQTPPQTTTTRQTSSNTGTGNSPENPFSCNYDSKNIKGSVDDANTTLNAVQLFMQQEMMGKLNTIDTKLGAEIPNGGISGFIKNIWNNNQVQKAINLLTLIGVWHNAMMLSNQALQTLFYGIDNLLEAFGVNLKDAEGNDQTIGQMFSNGLENIFKSILGDETVEEIQALYAKANRVYQAGANIINSIRSIQNTINEALEEISENTGKIGNALKRWGVVGEKSYNWMRENVDYRQGRFWRFLNNAQEATSSFEEITSNILDVTEEAEDLRQNIDEFQDAKNDLVQEVEEQEKDNTSASLGSEIKKSDEIGE